MAICKLKYSYLIELRVLEGTSGLTEEILDECELWRGKFPHLR